MKKGQERYLVSRLLHSVGGLGGQPPRSTHPARAPAGLGPLPSLRSVVLSKDRQLVATAGAVWEVRTSPDGGALLRWNWQHFCRRIGQARLDERSVDILRLYAAH